MVTLFYQYTHIINQQACVSCAGCVCGGSIVLRLNFKSRQLYLQFTKLKELLLDLAPPNDVFISATNNASESKSIRCLILISSYFIVYWRFLILNNNSSSNKAITF